MMALRVALGLLAAVFVIVVGGPIRWLALRRGWRTGRGFSVWVHKAVCAGLGVRIHAHGRPQEDGPQLVVANHISWLDIPILGSLRPTAFLAKSEVGGLGFVRPFLDLQGVVLVDRGRRRAIPAVNAEIARRMRSGAPVILFAEATTGDANRLLPFRSSHFEAARQALGAGAPAQAFVQPLLIVYSRRAGLPLTRSERPRVAWYGDMAFFNHFIGLVRFGRIDCDIYWGDSIRFLPDSDRKHVARRAQEIVRGLALEARLRNR